MELLTPSIGLLVWTTIIFLLLVVVLGKFAWKPILGALNEREQFIENALLAAERAKEEMLALTSSNEKMLAEARLERDKMLAEARSTKDAIVAEAKAKATAEADRLMVAAREAINNEKMAAITELKNQMATMSIEIAEKIIRQELSNDDKQKALVSTLLKEVTLN
jgi:F-type H+-transporting ATPase subunit b